VVGQVALNDPDNRRFYFWCQIFVAVQLEDITIKINETKKNSQVKSLDTFDLNQLTQKTITSARIH
jgi:hypothetical protein